MNFHSYFVISAVLSGVIYPLFGHWTGAAAGPAAPAGSSSRLHRLLPATTVGCGSMGGWMSPACLIVIGKALKKEMPARAR